MLDFEISKKLNNNVEKILDKSYYSFNPNTCYLIIKLYLNKDVDIICLICGSRKILVRRSKLSVIKTSFIDFNNVIVNALKDKTKTYSSIFKQFDVSTTHIIELFDRRIEARRLSLLPFYALMKFMLKSLLKILIAVYYTLHNGEK